MSEQQPNWLHLLFLHYTTPVQCRELAEQQALQWKGSQHPQQHAHCLPCTDIPRPMALVRLRSLWSRVEHLAHAAEAKTRLFQSFQQETASMWFCKIFSMF